MEINNKYIKIFLYKYITITMYILHFFNNTKKKVIYEESTHVFNRNIMTILLEQFEDDIYTFDDISTIIINDFIHTKIEDIPINLKKIEIINSYLNSLPQFPVSIEIIIINTSKIALSEDFTKYPNLKQLKMGVLSDTNSTYPPTLIFKHINVNIRSFYRKENYFVMPVEGVKQVNSLINNSQSVHISSVNKHICDSLLVIDELAAKYTKLENPILDIFSNRKIIKDKKKKNTNTRKWSKNKNGSLLSISTLYNFMNSISGNPTRIEKTHVQEQEEEEPEEEDGHNLITKMINWYSESKIDSRLIKEIMVWNSQESIVHSIHKISFSQLFEKIVRIIIHHKQRVNLTERLKTELTDSIGYCFTGRVNRMVNSLVGIVDGIKVSFSHKEQLLIESQMIIKRLMNKKITFEKAQEEMKEIFNDDEVRKDPLLVGLEKVYIESLQDYLEDEDENKPYNPNIIQS